MIQKLTFNNPITNKEDALFINIDDFNEYNWQIFTLNCEENKGLTLMLFSILNDLDCTIEYKCGRSCQTTYPKYNDNLSLFIKYLYRVTNYYEYNIWIDKLIKRHIENIVYEYNNPIPTNMLKKGDKSKKALPNKYIRHETTNIFTGEVEYIYDNLNTGDSIKSKDPNLLSVLNAKPHIKKKNKEIKDKRKEKLVLNIDEISFNF